MDPIPQSLATAMEVDGRLTRSESSSQHIIINEQYSSKTGNLWTACAQITTAAIGSGVLSLPWSVAQLGWFAGPLTMLAFAAVTLVSAIFLCSCYMSPHPDHGPTTNASYLDAVRHILPGKRNALLCIIVAGTNFVKLAIVSTITTSISMSAIQKSICYHIEGHNAACKSETTQYAILFGVLQLFMSQIVPSFQNTMLLSFISAAMSFTYAAIGLGLGFAKVLENGEIQGSIGGVVTSTNAEKVWAISQALGNIAFAFPFSLFFLNIRDTLGPDSSENMTMKKASIMGVCTTTFFYLSCGVFGYAAFGNSTPENLMSGFGFHKANWLIDLANACIVVNLVGEYQVLGVAGAINFWPIVVYFPVEMYLVQKKIKPCTKKWIILQIYSLVTFIVMLYAFIGSIGGLVAKFAKTHKH